jgi:transcriptional regulator with XRE-family HTH domain
MVAAETGFSPALISQIENNNVSPPIATLSRLAGFFDIEMSCFFEEDERFRFEVARSSKPKTPVQTVSEAEPSDSSYKKKLFRKRDKIMQAYLLSVSGDGEEQSTGHKAGEVCLFVLKGSAELFLDEQRIELHTGDSIYFEATLKYRLLSQNGEEARVTAVIIH